MKNLWQKRGLRWIVILVALGAFGAGSYYGARKVAWPAYKSWRAEKLNRSARALYAAQDYEGALIAIRRNLRDDKRNLQTWRLAAEVAKAKKSPEAIFFQTQVAKLDKRVSSQLELIRLALEFGYLRQALDAVAAVDSTAAASNAEYHRLAAQVHVRTGKPTTAKYHLYSLVQLAPDDAPAQLDLAEIELREDSARTNTAVREKIRALAAQPTLRTRALALLLADSIGAKRPEQARALSDELRIATDLTSEQKVLVLEGLKISTPSQAEAYRKKLETELATDAAGAVALTNYYRNSGQAEAARTWFDSLPEKTRADAEVQRAMADAFFALHDWQNLRRVISGANWGRSDFMRHAYTAYLAKIGGRRSEQTDAWKLAVMQAGDDARSTLELISRVNAWGWESERYDLVWKLFALMPRNEAISQQLIGWERRQGNTANLNRIFARLVEFNRENAQMKNNFAYTSLLLDSNRSQAYQYAREIYKADPTNPHFATTHAFALYKQGKTAEALAVVNALGAAALSEPERILFRALFLVGNGDAVHAAELINGLDSKRFLPEEQKLLAQTTSEILRIEQAKGQDSRLFALGGSGTYDKEKGWLRTLPAAVQKAATPEMELADSLYAKGEFQALKDALAGKNWAGQDYLRLALLAYAERSLQNEGGSRAQWRLALNATTRDSAKLQQLNDLAVGWEWRAERLEALDRFFESDPNDRVVLAELLNYHRAGKRTADMARVLSAYVAANRADYDHLSEFAYYSLLGGFDVSRAYVSAKAAFDGAPDQARPRLAYAFSLWKQKRPQDAWRILEDLPDVGAGAVPADLLCAAVLTDLDRKADALRLLDRYDAQGALPEETKLATSLRRQLTAETRVSGLE